MEPKIIGVNTRHYPAQASTLKHPGIFFAGEIVDQSENPPPTLAVLVGGDNEDYACYVGHGDKDWVARHGDKVSFQEANCHFPAIKKEKYRL